MFAAFSPGSDIKRYYRGRMPPRLALVVIMLMPLLYGAMYLWAFWNPFAAADKIPVALVNEDTGAVVEGQKLDAGAQVAAGADRVQAARSARGVRCRGGRRCRARQVLLLDHPARRLQFGDRVTHERQAALGAAGVHLQRRQQLPGDDHRPGRRAAGRQQGQCTGRGPRPSTSSSTTWEPSRAS